MKDRLLVFDVESVGLHGPAFAVGFVVGSFYGEITNEGVFAVPPITVGGESDDFKWVLENVNLTKEQMNCSNLLELRERFWQFYRQCHERCIIAADVPWPVEAKFLSECINDRLIDRKWKGPYPILDIASFRMGCGEFSMESETRKPDELPIHNPLCDARQSYRQLVRSIRHSERAVNILESL